MHLAFGIRRIVVSPLRGLPSAGPDPFSEKRYAHCNLDALPKLHDQCSDLLASENRNSFEGAAKHLTFSQSRISRPDLFTARPIRRSYQGNGLRNSHAFRASDRSFAGQHHVAAAAPGRDGSFGFLEKDIPKPDLVIYLQASTPAIMARIKIRDVEMERSLDEKYIARLNDAYNFFFFHYTDTPLLVVKTDNIDFVNNSSHLDDLVEQVKKPSSGKRYYTPASGLELDYK